MSFTWQWISTSWILSAFPGHLVKKERKRIRWRKEGGKSEEEEDRRMLQEWPVPNIPRILQFKKDSERQSQCDGPQSMQEIIELSFLHNGLNNLKSMGEGRKMSLAKFHNG